MYNMTACPSCHWHRVLRHFWAWACAEIKLVEERPGLITAGYGWHRSQWVKVHAVMVLLVILATYKITKLLCKM